MVVVQIDAIHLPDLVDCIIQWSMQDYLECVYLVKKKFPNFLFVKYCKIDSNMWKCWWEGFHWIVTLQDFIPLLKS